ncbi:MAG: winged helix-turn-helix transcriptional regulator, partial [Lachnospiraceae bacterium]|nr:winged helix-turn-helix transcriptional regulator [Lachnospiraceae bacterium]
CALILLGYFFFRYRQAKKKHEDFALLQKLPETLIESMQQWQTTEDGTLSYQGEKITLSKNEFRILMVLMKNKGKIVSREKLMEALWQTDAFVDENALTVNVGRLRKKLEGAGLENFIETKFGQGYLISQES